MYILADGAEISRLKAAQMRFLSSTEGKYQERSKVKFFLVLTEHHIMKAYGTVEISTKIRI
jgi:hypothetical protein